MYGDTTAIRHLASALHRQGAEIRADAATLLAHAVAAPWVGWAADAMRASAEHQAAGMRHTADLHDEAAAALLRHAHAVEETKALIASVEHHVRGLVDGARGRLADLVDAVADPLDDLLDHFVPPDPGSRDWLDVHLPGVHAPGLPGAVAP